MSLYAWVLLFAGVLYGLHHLALWMERRGWIYYVKKQPSVSSLGSAFLDVQSILQPNSKHVLEMKQDHRTQRDDQGNPPTPDTPASPPVDRSA